MIYLIICRTFAPENKRRCYVEFSEKLDIARCDACRCVRVFYLCQLRFSGADETVHEFFCGLSDSRFDLCSTIADFLQSATARVNAFSLAWMAVVVPACFGFACSCLVDIRTHGWCLQGGFRGCDGLPDLPDGYGSSCHHRQVRGECIQPDDLHVAVERSGGDSCPVDVSVGRTSCRYNLCDRFSEDIDITIDTLLSQGQKKKIKQAIVDSAQELGMTIENLDETRSRRDYNRYVIAYDSVIPMASDALKAAVLLETSYTAVSFPTVLLPVHSYIGDMMEQEAPDAIEEYNLNPFEMKVQGIDRTLADKVFAICDYYLQGKVAKHSRHLYDIYKLLPLVPQDENFRELVKEVRAVRAQSVICPSALPEADVPELLEKIIREKAYKQDYDSLTTQLLEENVPYDTVIAALKKVAESSLFENN